MCFSMIMICWFVSFVSLLMFLSIHCTKTKLHSVKMAYGEVATRYYLLLSSLLIPSPTPVVVALKNIHTALVVGCPMEAAESPPLAWVQLASACPAPPAQHSAAQLLA